MVRNAIALEGAEQFTYKPEGIMPALVTPFTYDQKGIDEEKLRFIVNRCIEQGVHGVVPCGTTGEFTSLTVEERKRVIKIVVDEANGTIPLDTIEELMIIVNVFVHPATLDRERVYLNNYKAMRHAIRKALEGRPDIHEPIENKELSRHPLKYSP